jgi:hypothetical protein
MQELSMDGTEEMRTKKSMAGTLARKNLKTQKQLIGGIEDPKTHCTPGHLGQE